MVFTFGFQLQSLATWKINELQDVCLLVQMQVKSCPNLWKSDLGFADDFEGVMSKRMFIRLDGGDGSCSAVVAFPFQWEFSMSCLSRQVSSYMPIIFMIVATSSWKKAAMRQTPSSEALITDPIIWNQEPPLVTSGCKAMVSPALGKGSTCRSCTCKWTSISGWNCANHLFATAHS